MDLNVNAWISATYLIPIAITLRKIYAPCFDIPEPIAKAVALVDTRDIQPFQRNAAMTEPASV